MSSDPEAQVPGLVRDAIAYPRLPWIRPLVEAVAHRYDTVASIFHGDPQNASAWRATAERVSAAARHRTDIAAVVAAQQQRRAAPEAAQRSAADLAGQDAVAVVTGQQAGLFGGPFYTLLKAITTIQLAREARERYGVAAVPVFWVDAEDHDWNEIRSATVLDRNHVSAAVVASDVPGCGIRPTGALEFDATIEDTLRSLADCLAPTEFSSTLMETLQRHYHPGASPAAAFAGWLETLLGSEGLVVFEASDPAAKPLAGDIFAHELAHPGETARLAREGGARLEQAGHHAQITPGDDVVSVFRVDEAGRKAIRWREGRFFVDDSEVAPDALRAEAQRHPERFSPNVLLRPVVQDRLFPTVCYVAGPSELAYHAQLGSVYQAFGVAPPLVANRISATVLDSAAVRFFDRTGLPLEALQAQDEAALNRLLASQMPAEVEETFSEVEGFLAGTAPKLARAAGAVDPTLTGAAETTVNRMRDTVKQLQSKILQAAKKKDETVRRQFARTQALTFPDGQPQERLLNVAYFVNRYGLDVGSRLLAGLPSKADAHYIIVP